MSQVEVRSWAKATPNCPYPATRPYHSTEKLSPVCATENMERVDGKRQKSLPIHVRLPSPKRRTRKRKEKANSADEPDPTTYTVPCAGQSPLHRNSLPLLPTSDTPPQATFRCATPPQVEAATSQILFIALTNLNQFDSLGMPQTHPPQLAFLYLPMNKLRPHFLSW